MAFEFKRIFPSAQDSFGGKRNVYVGIDFGTTFTKVSFQVGDAEGAKKYTLKYRENGNEEDYCIPTKLVYHEADDSLGFSQEPTEGFSEVKYFKYSMIERGVPRYRALDNPQANTKNDPQRICSAFFLANVIRDAIDFIKTHPALANAREDRLEWFINMGVPVSDYNAKPKPIFDEVLNVAMHYASSLTPGYTVSLSGLDEVYSRHKDSRDFHLKTIPELYAEIVMFLQNRNVEEGFYSVIDIGGGTTDLAVFFKRIDTVTHEVEIQCVAQDVRPLGYEMLFRDGRKPSEDEAKEFRTSYGTCMCAVKSPSFSFALKKLIAHNGHLRYFFVGGARKVPFYHECVDFMIGVHEMGWHIAKSEEEDILDFIKGSKLFDVKDNSRILISQMLAQPYEKIPPLTGMPWSFDACSPAPLAPAQEELWERL